MVLIPKRFSFNHWKLSLKQLLKSQEIILRTLSKWRNIYSKKSKLKYHLNLISLPPPLPIAQCDGSYTLGKCSQEDGDPPPTTSQSRAMASCRPLASLIPSTPSLPAPCYRSFIQGRYSLEDCSSLPHPVPIHRAEALLQTQQVKNPESWASMTQLASRMEVSCQEG